MRRIFASTFLLLLFLCQTVLAAEIPVPATKWLTCFYVSGADLESNLAEWQKNMYTLEQNRQGKDSVYLLQFGGTTSTRSNVLLERGFPNQDILIYREGFWYSTGWNLHRSSMGSPKTMADFLEAAKQISAEKRCLFIWGHGGGSLYGSPYDAVTNEHLSLNGLREALAAVYVPDLENPPLDIVAFDSCYMNTIDTANALKGFAKYLVASAELVPTDGFDYDAYSRTLKKNPDISAEEFARVIASSYASHTPRKNTLTTSVIDLRKIDRLNKAYSDFLQELLRTAGNDYSAKGILRRAYYADHYGGGNLYQKNYIDMVDLYDLAYDLREFAPNTYKAVMDVVDEVQPFYQLGKNHALGSSLSAYFPRSCNRENLDRYRELQMGLPAVTELAERMLGLEYDVKKLHFHPSTLENGALRTTLTREEINELITVEARMYRQGENGDYYFVGSDSRLKGDWSTGEIEYKLPDSWFFLNGHYLPSYIADIRDNSSIFVTPVTVNGTDYYLSFDDAEDGVHVLGLVEKLKSANYCVDNMRPLNSGDNITLKYVALDKNNTLTPMDTFTISGTPVIENRPVPPGQYKVLIAFIAPDQSGANTEWHDWVVP